MDDDSELLRRYAEEGSEAAFEELVRRRIALVYGSAFRQLGDVHRTKEVVQVVFTDLARKASALCRRPVLVSWLYTSTHYAVANLSRQERRRRVREHEAQLMQDIDAGGGPSADWDRMRPFLDKELHALSTRDRDAVLLRYFESKSFAEIGETLSLSEEAARKRVERALESLRVRLGGQGVASTAAMLSAILTEQAAIAAPGEWAGMVARIALVQSAGAGTTTTGILTLMSTSKTALGVGALLMLLSVGSAVYEGWRARISDAALASLEGQDTASARELAALTSKVATAEQAAAILEKQAQATTPAVTAAGGAQAPSSAVKGPRAVGEAFMARHPEVRDALVAYADAADHARYAALYAQLGLTADQIRQMEILLRQQAGSFGRMLQNGMATFSLSPDGSFGGLFEVPAGLTALLGDAGYQQFLAYSQTLPARSVASNLASLLAATDAPLSAGQAQQLVPILTNAAGKANPDQFDWNSVYANAQGLLSAPQLEMLKNVGTDSQGWRQVYSPAP